MLILSLSFSLNAYSQSVLERFGLIQKGVCQDGSRLGYTIVQKLDDHHYEMRIEGDEPLAILETKKAIYDNVGRPIGIGVIHKGQKAMKLKNGFSQSVHIWQECSFDGNATTLDPGWAIPRKVILKNIDPQKLEMSIPKIGDVGASGRIVDVSEEFGNIWLTSDEASFKVAILKNERTLFSNDLKKIIQYLKKAEKNKKISPDKDFIISSLGGEKVIGKVESADLHTYENGVAIKTLFYRLSMNIQLKGEEKPRWITVKRDSLEKLLKIVNSKK